MEVNPPMTDHESAIARQDLKECWCCGGLHDSIGTLCPDCDKADCNRFTDDCSSDHLPVLPDGGCVDSEVETEHVPPAADRKPELDVNIGDVLDSIDADAQRIIDHGDVDAAFHARQIQQGVAVLREAGIDA